MAEAENPTNPTNTTTTIGAKKPVKVTIKISWLLFDIMNETFLRGRTIQNKENHKEVASMFASEDEENREKILRSIKRSFAEVQTELGEYLNENGTTTDNSHYDGTENLVLNLIMPSNFNEAATTGVGEAIHAYLANNTIADWYIVTNKQDAEQYYALAAKNIELIRQTVSKRSRPVRPKD